MTDKTPLFSEQQVNQLVEAKVKVFNLETQLRDNPPQTVTVDVKALLSKLKEMEADIIKKHQQALKAWRRAVNIYADFLKKNPGSRALNPPDTAPKLGSKIEIVRGWIRAYEVITDKTTKLSMADWTKLFQDASSAVADMRALRDSYSVYVSGATTLSLSNTATTFR